MSDEKDYTKLQSFIEAAITNPRHPVYQLGMNRAASLQHFALNVKSTAFSGGLAVMESGRWFKDYPHWVEQLEEVMKLCEEDATNAATAVSAAAQRITDLEATVNTLTAKISELTAKPASDTPAA